MESQVSTHWPVCGSRKREVELVHVLGDDVDDAALERVDVDGGLFATDEIHLVWRVRVSHDEVTHLRLVRLVRIAIYAHVGESA